MIHSNPDLTHLKPPVGRTFSRWPSPGLALSACVATVCLSSLPARATGFLDDPSTWTGATPCTDVVTSSCVIDYGDGSYDIGGTGTAGSYTITSPTATINTLISFNYKFTPDDSDGAVAEFSLNGSTYTPLPEAELGSSPSPLLLTSGNSFSFRLTNITEQPILGLSDFTATPVPAPLPLLGGAAAFGWIRRRRSQLKARQLVR